jgi:hypothetical protein
MTIDEAPIFIVGTGRSGTTILYSCLAMHPELGWISSWVGLAPQLPMAVFNRFWALPGTDRFRETRFFPRPAEPFRVFPRALSTYRKEAPDQADIAEARQNLAPLIRRIRQLQGRPRFLTKMAGRPVKSELFARVFPDAFFIHITRDLKPTVASLLQVEFYDAASPLDPWPWGVIPQPYRDFYERHGRTPVVAAAIKVRLNRIEQEHQLKKIPTDRWAEVGYANFVSDPITHIRALCERAGLQVDERFLRRVQSRKIYGGADKKWMKFFRPEQIESLEEFERMPDLNPR